MLYDYLYTLLGDYTLISCGVATLKSQNVPVLAKDCFSVNEFIFYISSIFRTIVEFYYGLRTGVKTFSAKRFLLLKKKGGWVPFLVLLRKKVSGVSKICEKNLQ